MAKIIGIQKRGEFGHSDKGYSDYDKSVDCEGYLVRSLDRHGGRQVTLFFPRRGAPKEGVGMQLDPGPAIAVARALLSVAEGHASEVQGRF